VQVVQVVVDAEEARTDQAGTGSHTNHPPRWKSCDAAAASGFVSGLDLDLVLAFAFASPTSQKMLRLHVSFLLVDSTQTSYYHHQSMTGEEEEDQEAGRTDQAGTDSHTYRYLLPLSNFVFLDAASEAGAGTAAVVVVVGVV